MPRMRFRFAIVLFFGLVSVSAISASFANEQTRIDGWVLFGDTPICAMVLANGQDMFSCQDGRYQIDVPLDDDGMITLFAFAAGFAPYQRTLTPVEAKNLLISMNRESSGRELSVVKYFAATGQPGWYRVSGSLDYAGTPICALILANGQRMFSCNQNLGRFDFDVPADNDGIITLFAFAAGFQPFKITFDTAANPLNDTGIVTCADDDSNRLDCPVYSHPDQDAEHGRDVRNNDDSDGHAGFSFTKLDQYGNPLPANAASWVCVRDNATGLIWEVKTRNGGLQDREHSYSWYDPDGERNGGFAGYADLGACNRSECDTLAYVQAVNERGLCGRSGWRLPGIRELESLILRDRIDPATETRYFPHARAAVYWSSTPLASNAGRAWAVSFEYGNTSHSPKREPQRIRLVHDWRN